MDARRKAGTLSVLAGQGGGSMRIGTLCLVAILAGWLAGVSPTAAEEFNDCEGAAWCPAMIAVPGGSFTMGSPTSEEGRQRGEVQHEVTIAPFAVGKFEVTIAQFRVFAEEARPRLSLNCLIRQVGLPGAPPTRIGDWEHVGFQQAPDHPVVCVRWQDAQAYVAWLSERTGHRYRLLTESEWEYAARAGTTTAFYWGDAEDHEFANTGNRCCFGYASGRDAWEYTSPVGAFPANAFGLHDMTGNVGEWVEDCSGDYADAPTNGEAFTSATCEEHVYRGGSWLGHTDVSRIARRFDAANHHQLFGVGFRVARDLP